MLFSPQLRVERRSLQCRGAGPFLSLGVLVLAVLTARPLLPLVAKEPAAKRQPAEKVPGRVVDQDGKPVANARVAVVVLPGQDSVAAPQVLAQARTDARGRYHLEVKNPTPARRLVTLVSAPGYGLGWHYPLSPAAGLVRLQREEVIHGRLIDLQGQPAAGVKVLVCRLGTLPRSQPGYYRLRTLKLNKGKAKPAVVVKPIAPSMAGKMMLGGPAQASATQPSALAFAEPPVNLPFWPRPATTDAQGRFSLRGCAGHHGVGVQVRDSRFALQALAIPPQKERPAEIALVLTPARLLEGTVVDADTSKPIPNARLHLPAPHRGQANFFVVGTGGEADWRGRRMTDNLRGRFVLLGFYGLQTQDELPGIDVQADREGRYRIPLFQAGSYTVEVSAPSGEPYFKMTRTVNWPRAAARQELQVPLVRGVWVRGRVSETASGKPVAQARIDFWSPGLKLPGGVRFPTALTTGADGTFQALLLPGRWQLLVNSTSADYAFQKVAAVKLIGTQTTRVVSPDGPVVTMDGSDKKHFFYPDGWVALDLKPRADIQQTAVQLRRVTLRGKLVGPDGKPTAQAVLFSRHPLPNYGSREANTATRRAYGAFWGRLAGTDAPVVSPRPVRDGRFEFPVRDPEARYRLFFLDASHSLGAVIDVSVKEALTQPPTVRLAACGSARARFLDDKGKPLVKYQPQLWLLLPEGPHTGDGTLPKVRRVLPLDRGKTGALVKKQQATGDVVNLLKFARTNPLVLDATGQVVQARQDGLLAHDRIWLGHADPLHYGKGPLTDAQGNVTFPALIPGATYRLTYSGGKPREFKAEAGKTVNLGDVTVKPPAPKPILLPHRIRNTLKLIPKK